MTLSEIVYSHKSDEYITPEYLYEPLNEIFNFELDPATTRDNPLKTKFFFTKRENGLFRSWPAVNTFLNPPYSETELWVKKTYEQFRINSKINPQLSIVMLVAARTDTKWMHQYVLPFVRNKNIFSSDPIDDKVKWAAGLMDGECCIFIRKGQVTELTKHKSTLYDMGLHVAMTNKSTIYRLRDIFNVGWIQEQNRNNPKWKKSWRWTCRSNAARYVLSLVEPYLFNKREEARLALEFQELGSARNRRKPTDPDLLIKRENIYTKMRELKLPLESKVFDEPYYKELDIEIKFIRGRLKFRGQENSAPFPSILLIFRNAD